MFAIFVGCRRGLRSALGVVGLLAMAACGGGGGGDGAHLPVQPPMAVTLSAAPEPIKQVVLNWAGVAPDATVVVQENLDGQSGFADQLTLPPGTTTARLPVFLPTRWGAQYRLRACWAMDCQESRPVGLSRELDAAVGYFKPAAQGGSGQFGASVAVSSDGGTLAVGAPGARTVEVFVREGAAWRPQAVLLAPGGVDGHWGASLALSGDGALLVVGAPQDQAKGQVVVWSRVGQTWSHQATLSGAGSGADAYGAAVAWSSSGDYLAVGAPRERQGAVASGAVYVYFHGSAAWRLLDRRDSPDLRSDTGFGTSVALSADGTSLLVGAPQSGAGIGAAHVYALGGQVFHWSASLAGAPDQGDRQFGQSVAWAQRNGTPWVAVGAPCSLSLLAVPCAGAVHVWRAGAPGAWVQEAVWQAAEPRPGDLFGYAVALSANASVLAVGTPNDAGGSRGIGPGTGEQTADGSGAAYVFRRSGEEWLGPVAVKAPNAGRYDDFGRGVALSAEGDTLAVGAPWEASAATGIGGDASDDSLLGRGAVYLY